MEKVINKTLLTEQGFIDLKNELDNLIQVKRPANIKAIKEARALGDLSENAEYDAARNEQAEIEGRIQQLEKLLENVEIINESLRDTSKVSIGTTVVIQALDEDETEEYQIVGSQEADPFENKISNESAIAKAILNKAKDDVCTVMCPNGTSYEVKIVEIR